MQENRRQDKLDPLSNDVALIGKIPTVATILDVICRTTGMGFAAVARVTEDRWIVCTALDKIGFGLEAGGELRVESTICHEVRRARKAVIIDHVCQDEVYRDHHTPREYGFQSYISMPIFLPGGKFFGTLCAIDPKPAKLSTPEVVGMFQLFSELIAFHIDSSEKLAHSESTLVEERGIAELREQFIGVLGHDLRSPLGAISMGATLLRQTGLNEEQTATVDMMTRSVARMSDLISDSLDFTRGRLGGGIALEAQSKIPVEVILNQVIEEVRTTHPKREIQAHLQLREPIHYDRKRIAQLFNNLLSNAVTHGKADRPILVTAVSGDGRFELSVSNAADPIPPAVLTRLFEPFSRGGAGNYQEGLGLGLYIASEIARSHGGTLGVASSAEETRFTFSMPTVEPLAADTPAPNIGSGTAAGWQAASLPATLGEHACFAGEKVPSAAEAIANPPVLSGARILLVEDHEDTLRTLARLLTRKGHRVTQAATATEARTEYARGEFDLVVSDLGLPDSSGLQLIAELTASRRTPAIAMSGYGTESDIQSCIAAGFQEHVTKPIDFEYFLRVLDRVIHSAVR